MRRFIVAFCAAAFVAGCSNSVAGAGDRKSEIGADQLNQSAMAIVRPSVHISTIGEAQSAARELINEAGESCSAVTSLSPIGQIASGETVHRANCSNGDRYVIALSDDNAVRFLSSCPAFSASTGQHC